MASRNPTMLKAAHRRRASPSPTLSSFFVQKAGSYVGIATAATLVLALALAADILLLQQYERVLSAYHESSNDMGKVTSRRTKRLGNSENGLEVKYHIKEEQEGLKLAWLMSFPNSGTSFTSQLVRDATKTDSASNYADETPSGEAGYREPVYDDMPDGPFWIKPEASPEFSEPTEYVITKVSKAIQTDCAVLIMQTVPNFCSFHLYPLHRLIAEFAVLCVHQKSTQNQRTASDATVLKRNGSISTRLPGPVKEFSQPTNPTA